MRNWQQMKSVVIQHLCAVAAGKYRLECATGLRMNRECWCHDMEMNYTETMTVLQLSCAVAAGEIPTCKIDCEEDILLC